MIGVGVGLEGAQVLVPDTTLPLDANQHCVYMSCPAGVSEFITARAGSLLSRLARPHASQTLQNAPGMVGMVLEIMRCTGARRARVLSIEYMQQNWLHTAAAEKRS